RGRNAPGEQFAQLGGYQDHTRCGDTLEPVFDSEGCGSERCVQPRQVNDCNLQYERQRQSSPKPRVREQSLESTRLMRTTAQAIEELRENQYRKCRCARFGHAA